MNDVFQITEANLPSEACIELPKVHVSAEYIQDSSKPKDNQSFATGKYNGLSVRLRGPSKNLRKSSVLLLNERMLTDGAVLRAGNYLSAVADIGVFEHSLTTDLLNHLMFVQKVFMKVSSEVVLLLKWKEAGVAFS